MTLGIALDNVDVPPPGSYAKAVSLKAQVVGTLWTNGTRHRRSVYQSLEANLPGVEYSVRVGPSQKITVEQWLRDLDDAHAEIPPSALPRVTFRHLNEVNLPDEGNWEAAEYADNYNRCRELATSITDRPIGTSPVSLGLPTWQTWYNQFVAAGGIEHAPFIYVNAYAHLLGEMAYFLGLGPPVKVSEFNTLDLNNRAAWIIEQYQSMMQEGVRSAEIFIVGGQSHGAWPEQYILTESECAQIGQRPLAMSTDFYPDAKVTLLTRNFDAEGTTPKIIVAHGTSGLGDPYNWWNRPNALPTEVASADFWIPRADNMPVQQYVRMSHTSWSNGPLNKPDLSVPFLQWLVWYKQTHPEATGNTWTVAAEFEKPPGNTGTLTKSQLRKGRALFKWLSQTFAIPLDRNHVLGHYQFDSVNRPNCPRLSEAEWRALLYDDALAAHNFWNPMWHAKDWAHSRGRISTEERTYIENLVIRDKIAAGVQ